MDKCGQWSHSGGYCTINDAAPVDNSNLKWESTRIKPLLSSTQSPHLFIASRLLIIIVPLVLQKDSLVMIMSPPPPTLFQKDYTHITGFFSLSMLLITHCRTDGWMDARVLIMTFSHPLSMVTFFLVWCFVARVFIMTFSHPFLTVTFFRVLWFVVEKPIINATRTFNPSPTLPIVWNMCRPRT